MTTSKITVMVTGLGGGGYGMQILKALRLSQLNYRIIGADMTARSYGLSLADESVVLPPAIDPKYLDELIGTVKDQQVQALFYGSEPELKVLSRARDRFDELDVMLPLNPADLIDTCLDKSKTMAKLSQLGFDVPLSLVVSSVAELDDFESYPAVCKPSTGGGGSNNVFIAQDQRELVLLTEYLLGHCKQVLVQEYIGTVDSEYTVGVLTDLDGNLIDSIAVKRNIMSALSNRIRVTNRNERTDLGDTLAVSSGISQGMVDRFPEVTDVCMEAAKALGTRGPINFQCRKVDGKIIIFEINPRFSGTTSVRAMVGFNEPDMLIRIHLLGERIGPVDYRRAVVLRGLNERVIEYAD